MQEPTIYTADRIFTGEQWLSNYAISVFNGYIEKLIPLSCLSSAQRVKQFENGIIVPAFIDLQIYGALGKLLSAYPDPDTLHLISKYSQEGGAAYCLPAVATNTTAVFYHCIDAVKSYWKNGGRGVLGLHLEGPWINPVKRGAHIASLIHAPAEKEVIALLEYGKGVIKMITLAPEICSKEIIHLIRSYNIIVSAGHSNATFEEAKLGFANGITAVTHLFNAMSPLHHRMPGLPGAAMLDASVMASIIPDGHHVDYAAISIAKKVMKERLFVITDAVTETTEGDYLHRAAGDKYEADHILSGSALTMLKALNNLVNHVQVDPGEAINMCSLYPAKVAGLLQMGKIAPGYRAEMNVLSDHVSTKGMQNWELIQPVQ